MPVDEYRMAIDAIAGDVGNIVIAIDSPNPAANCLDRIEQDVVIDIFGTDDGLLGQASLLTASSIAKRVTSDSTGRFTAIGYRQSADLQKRQNPSRRQPHPPFAAAHLRSVSLKSCPPAAPACRRRREAGLRRHIRRACGLPRSIPGRR